MIPRVERLNNGLPVLKRAPGHPWENKVTFNPACAFVHDKTELDSIIPNLPFNDKTKKELSSHKSLVFLLYRAQGMKTTAYDHSRSSIGLAVLSPALEFLARHTEPVILPDREYENLGVEDARITKVGREYIMTYTAYSSGRTRNRIRIGVATTNDFVHWKKHGLLDADFNEIDNKNCMLFEQKVGENYLMLHRPMEGPDAMCIHWASSSNALGPWKSRGVLMKPIPNSRFVDTWIGGGAPPLRLIDGRFLVVYHIGNRDAKGGREYDLGIAVLDPSKDRPVIQRDEPLLRPETPAETMGDADLGVNNVVFICGAYFYERSLYFPYAGADTSVLAGRMQREELERYTGSHL